VAKDGIPTVSEIAQGTTPERYEVIRHPDGTVEIDANGKADHSFAMDALERTGPLDQEPYYRELMQAQGLQTLGVPSEIRAAYVGHELDDEHHAAYSRAPAMKDLLDG
jgi:hypothetical protein